MRKILEDVYIVLPNGDPIRFDVADFGIVYSYTFHGMCSTTGFRSYFAYKQEVVDDDVLAHGKKVAAWLNADLRKVAKGGKFKIDHLKKFAEKAGSKEYKEFNLLEYVKINIVTGNS